MSSSSRLLARPELRDEPCALAAPPPAADPFVRAQVDEAAARAYERGRRDGEATARAGLEASTGRVEAAFARVCEELAALRRERAGADVELAAAISEVLLDREPHDGGRALLARLREALAELDGGPLSVRVHPDDAEVVRAALAVDGSVEVEAVEHLRPGEAVVDGRFASAELTRAAALDAVRAVVAGEARA